MSETVILWIIGGLLTVIVWFGRQKLNQIDTMFKDILDQLKQINQQIGDLKTGDALATAKLEALSTIVQAHEARLTDLEHNCIKHHKKS